MKDPGTTASRPTRRPSVEVQGAGAPVWRARLPTPPPRPSGPDAGAQLAACASLRALPLAPGCCRGKSLLLATSFRFSGESVNSTFLISESLEKRHSTAAGCTPGPRAPAPRARKGTPRAAAGKRIGVRGVGEAEPRRKRGQSKDPVRKKSGGHSGLGDPLGPAAQGASSLCASRVASSSRWRGVGEGMGWGLRNAASGCPCFGF